MGGAQDGSGVEEEEGGGENIDAKKEDFQN